MKVQGPGRPGVGQVESAQTNQQLKSLEQSKTTRAPEEKIQVSSLSKLLSQVRNTPDAPDMQKVDRIKDELASGTFKVDPERTIQAMLQEEI
jgi:flagellar biosynthesis anti-sigma factor FlgM